MEQKLPQEEKRKDFLLGNLVKSLFSNLSANLINEIEGLKKKVCIHQL